MDASPVVDRLKKPLNYKQNRPFSEGLFCSIIEKKEGGRMNEYQERAKEYDLFRATGDFNTVAFVEKVLGLVGEAGETADKIKKILRDKEGKISDTDRIEVAKELGDTLWYVATVARYIGMSLQEVAEMNLQKLESRKQRNLLSGEGDNR